MWRSTARRHYHTGKPAITDRLGRTELLDAGNLEVGSIRLTGHADVYGGVRLQAERLGLRAQVGGFNSQLLRLAAQLEHPHLAMLHVPASVHVGDRRWSRRRGCGDFGLSPTRFSGDRGFGIPIGRRAC